MNTEIKTFELALADSGTEKEIAFFSNADAMNACDSDDIAYKRIKVITRAINRDPVSKEFFKPDYNDRNYKYWIYFGIKADAKRASGFAFSDSYYAYSGTIASSGSRLCFKDYDTYKHFKEYFLDEYLPFILME